MNRSIHNVGYTPQNFTGGLARKRGHVNPADSLFQHARCYPDGRVTLPFHLYFNRDALLPYTEY